MILSNFLNIDAVDNLPGYYRFWFIHESSVTFIPPAINGVIDFEKITYAPGKDTWYIGGAYFDELELGEREQKSANGSLYPINIAGKTAGVQPSTLSLFHNMRNARFILIIADNNGNYFLCGEPNNGLIFDYSRESAYLKFTYKGNYTIPCWFLANYLGSDPIPEPGGGGTGGGIVTIKRADGTTITTVTAPAEYTVANTNAVLKDTAGATLSTTAIKPAGAAQNITAPDATITLKDTAGSTLDTIAAKSGESKNVVAPNGEAQLVNSEAASIGDVPIKAGEAKEVVIPDTEITVKNSLGLSIENLEVPSCQPNEILIGDSNVIIKNTDDDILYDVEVAASASGLKVINDSTVEVKDSAGDLIIGKTVAAEKTADTTIADSTVEITNTLDEVIATVNVKASNSATNQINDSNLTLNGAAWAEVPAKSNKDFALVDELDNLITPLVADATQIKVNTNASLMAYMIGDN